jgi:hypothetical protein
MNQLFAGVSPRHADDFAVRFLRKGAGLTLLGCVAAGTVIVVVLASRQTVYRRSTLENP